MKAELNIRALRSYRSRRLNRPDLVSSAALIPIVQHKSGDQIVLLARHDRLRFQPGDISFPGGKVEPQDSDLSCCALREAQEEMSLPRAHVQLLAELDQVSVASRYLPTPFAGLVEASTRLRPHIGEVKRLITVDVEDLISPDSLETTLQVHQHMLRPSYRFTIHDVTIWEATARVLKRFLEIGYGARYSDARTGEQNGTI